jgi:ABC-2 type transport system permease protein
MSAASRVALVASREIRQRLRSRAFAIFTVILCAAIIGIGVLRSVLDDNGPTVYDVAVTGELTDDVRDTLRAAASAFDVEVRLTMLTRSNAEAAVRNGDADAALDATGGEIVWDTERSDKLGPMLDAAWTTIEARRLAAQAGLDDAQIDRILSPAPPTDRILEPDDDDDAVGTVVGMAAAVLLFIMIQSFGGYVLIGVVEEKTTGVVEVLLSHVRAHQLLAGKVFGIGTVAFIQFSAAVAAGLVSLRISGVSVPSQVWVGLPSTILWFVGGYVLYSTLFALAGSFVSRQEDAQGAAAPISLVFTAAYLSVFALASVPRATTTRILSVLPPFAPLLMPLRIATGAASILEIAVAAVLLLAAIYGMLRLAGAVYARTLLHRGSRLRWRQALRMRRESAA